ncbi:MAG: anti-sigma F factor [Clostridia bacterium]|nr:anti-sigma F factor [Clostridia bacterium]
MNCIIENTCKCLEKNDNRNEYENEFKLEIKSKSANEAFVRVAIAAFASQLDPTIEQIADIKTAVSEAITNCIIHAYDNSEGIIKVNAYLTQTTIEIDIIDFGQGIENVDMARQTLYTSKPDKDRSGMGFTIMESFMDELKVESILNMGTKIHMKKIIKEVQ